MQMFVVADMPAAALKMKKASNARIPGLVTMLLPGRGWIAPFFQNRGVLGGENILLVLS